MKLGLEMLKSWQINRNNAFGSFHFMLEEEEREIELEKGGRDGVKSMMLKQYLAVFIYFSVCNGISFKCCLDFGISVWCFFVRLFSLAMVLLAVVCPNSSRKQILNGSKNAFPRVRIRRCVKIVCMVFVDVTF